MILHTFATRVSLLFAAIIHVSYISGAFGIIQGVDAPPNRYPYFALLELENEEGSYFCGASLIHSDILLSAASCFINQYSADAAVNATSFSNRSAYEKTTRVDKIVVHPDFRRTAALHDIALLRIQTPVFDIDPLEFNRDAVRPLDQAGMLTVGLGLLSFVGFRDPEYLQQAFVNAIPHQSCNSVTSYHGTIDNDRTICAHGPARGPGQEMRDSCFGDAGGPLVVSTQQGNPSGDIQVGITSSGEDCGLADFPGTYTRVSSYANWIDDEICKMSEYPPSECGEGSAPTPSPASVGFCFSGTSLVKTQLNGEIPMSELMIGDKVLVDSSASGEKYDTVYSFGHLKVSMEATLLEIHTDKSLSPLKISHQHMVFVHSPSKKRGKQALPASAVRLGDKLVLGTGEVATVQRIGHGLAKGIYSPFTYSGTLIVDGVLVSNYVAFSDSALVQMANFTVPITYHWAAYIFEAPHRIISRFRLRHEEVYSQQGLSMWVDCPFRITTWLLRQPIALALPLFLLFLCAFTAALIFEMTILDLAVALLALLLVLAVVKNRAKIIIGSAESKKVL